MTFKVGDGDKQFERHHYRGKVEGEDPQFTP